MDTTFPDDSAGLTATQDPTQAPVTQDDFDSGDIDYNHDGVVDGMWWTLDSGVVVAVIDTDSDDVADVLQFDTDGDGLVDVVVVPDGDGFLLKTDTDPEGTHVTREELQEGAPQLAELVNAFWPATDDIPADGGYDGPQVTDGQLVGDPASRGLDWFQQAFDGSCMPASIAVIATFYTGEQYTDLEFISLVNQVHGWAPDPTGSGPSMTVEGAVTVLNALGIPAHADEGTVNDLIEYLGEDRAIIVAIDSSEVWDDQDGKAPEVEDDLPDHAVTVTGIDTQNGIVYLNDTGTPDGAAMEVPLDVFMDAWADSGNSMVVCDQTAEEFRDANGIPQDEPTDGQPAVAPIGAAADTTPLTLPEQTEGPLDFVRTHPFVLLPVLIAAGAVVRSVSK
ncbi:C39 family peptidase [Salinibacterium sp. G-O1]|uniref:C39 family peptidase n=1 Tax=Salinibacterium sp. G-O1 TaxID=3046208 RepID=UPI0024B88E16|nr:C39 family peptidase [Salinibacterium sp. G-O1]MDJ0334598.1 C39 family peptidase [Salinibacterium sp. G-O1]